MDKVKQKKLSVMVAAVVASLAFAPLASAVTFPFLNPGVTPPQDVIAANLDEITPQNTVTVVHNVPQTTASTTVEQYANPSTASFGLVSAIKDPNMSQKVPDCAPPPTPAANCNNIGQCGSPGNVSWSGWDKVSGGVCNGGSAGGWLVTAAGAAPANYYPPEPVSTGLTFAGGGTSYTTPYGNTVNSNGSVTLANGQTVQGTVSGNGVTFVDAQGIVVTDQFTSTGYSTVNSAGAVAVTAGHNLAGNASTSQISTPGTFDITGQILDSGLTSSNVINAY